MSGSFTAATIFQDAEPGKHILLLLPLDTTTEKDTKKTAML